MYIGIQEASQVTSSASQRREWLTGDDVLVDSLSRCFWLVSRRSSRMIHGRTAYEPRSERLAWADVTYQVVDDAREEFRR
jgi:hypothetical protein